MDSFAMELIDNLATYLIENKYKENTYIIQPNKDVRFSETAQDEYNNICAEIETLIIESDLISIKKKCEYSKGFTEYLKQGGRDWD